MQYARPARIAWCLALLAGCGTTSQPATVPPDGAVPGAQPEGGSGTEAGTLPDSGRPIVDTPPDADSPPLPPDALPPASACGAETAPLRRLSTTQYQRTVRALTGFTVTTTFPPAQMRGGFEDLVDLQDSGPTQVAAWSDAANEVAAAVATKLPALTNCVTIDDACAKAFIADFGKRAYRRPLSTSEQEAHLTVYNQVKALGDASDGILAVLRVMLQSPQFLYRPELGGVVAAGRMTPSPYETATRLSYFLWGNMPDEELFKAADALKLSTPDQIDAQIRRMLVDTRARQGTNDFVRQWLGLDQVLTVQKDGSYPAWNAPLAAAMREEGYRFAQRVIFDEDGTLSTLLTGTKGTINGPLAQLYGVTITGTDWQDAELSSAHRLGLLTQGWFLAGRSNIATRGVFVRERLFCDLIPPPPAGIDPPPPQSKPGLTGREWYQSQLANPACAACHNLFDGMGFTFESYDGIGAFRTTDGGKPIDASGDIVGSQDSDGKVPDAAALIRRLATSNQVRDCVVKRWYPLSSGHEIDGDTQCRAQEIARLFRAGNGSLKELAATIALDAARRPRPSNEVVAAMGAPLIVTPEAQRNAQKIVLDLVSSQVVQLRQRLALEPDRLRLDQHLQGLRELEKNLSTKP